jgi:hypothetical protein
MQPEPEKLYSLGEVSVNEADHSVTATEALYAFFGHGGVCCAVSQIPKSVVREIRTLRSEGVPGRKLPGSTRLPGGQPPGSTRKYAKLPEGCGLTVHCSGCAIRNTVMDTVQTGKVHRFVPAYLNPNSDIESHRFELLISTERKGGVVFLKVEEMNAAVPNKSIDHDK